MIRQVVLIFLLSCSIGYTYAQSVYVPAQHSVYHFIDRMDILYADSLPLHTSLKYYKREDIKYILSHDRYGNVSDKDIEDIQYLRKEFRVDRDTSLGDLQKGIFKTFYKNPVHLFELETDNFELVINPFFNFRIGKDRESDDFIFLNRRGIELFGVLDKRLYFYSSFIETQSNFYNYINPYIDQYLTIPGNGLYKDYNSRIISQLEGYDYSNAQAYIGYPITKHVCLELGHNKHFIGNGIRSLLLSDFSHNYFYLKMNTRIWKLEYQSIFAELSSRSPRQVPNNDLLPKKYMASHYLNFRFNPKFEIGLFESVVFSRENNFEFQYLNPVILYRSAEHFLDSPDNVLIGLNAKYNIFHRVSIYSQLLLDEFNSSRLFDSSKWWGNKYGIQIGAKYINILGIDHLDGQVEYNRVRPYTYSHFKPSEDIETQSSSSYAHNNQTLAHPAGSNFSELIIKLRYQPIRKIIADVRYIYTLKGVNGPDENFGSDILLLNTSRVMDFGVNQHQGNLSTINMLNLDISYELFHDFYIDLSLLVRRDRNSNLGDTNTTFLGTGIRYNIYNTTIDY